MITLFGIRSPLVVEFEETCDRLGIKIAAAVSVNGSPRLMARDRIINLAAFSASAHPHPFFACAFTPRRRAQLIAQARALGLALAPALIDPHAVLARTVRVGEGSFLNAGVIVGAVTIIGDGVLVNRGATIGHHCVIGDHVSIGPGATLAGNIQVGEGAMIGVGAVILPDVRIGAGAIVAGGSLVRSHVPEGVFVAGNPAVARPYDASKSSLNIEDGE